MDIRQLNYFLSVADNLNFTKAAERHHITQTAISQQIMSLEQELEVKLFHRDKRSVQLTPAGKVFYREVKLMVTKTEEAINKTRQAACGFEGTLSIGFLGHNEKTYLPELIKIFRRTHPKIDLIIDQKNAGRLREGLEQGTLDVAFGSSYGLKNAPGLDLRILKKDPLCVVVYRDHPLFNEPQIPRTALANESFVAIDRKEAPFAFDSMIHDCMKSGFSPNIVISGRTIESVLLLIEAQIGIGLLRGGLEVNRNNNLRFINLQGENEYVEVVAAWKQDNPNPAVPLFLKELDQLLQAAQEN